MQLSGLPCSFHPSRDGSGLGVSFTRSLQHYLILASLLVLLAHNLGWFNDQPHLRFIIYNLVLAAHSVLLIIRGTDNLQWKQTALGCVMLVVLIMARFDDLFESLLMRSLAFILSAPCCSSSATSIQDAKCGG